MAIYFGKTITEKLALADTYFGLNSHIRHYDWDGYSDDDQKAALVQSEREIDAHLGITLEQNYSSTSFPIVTGSSYRPDYAVMEHAFFMLENTARTRSSASGAEMIESEQYQEQEKTTGLNISPTALMYLRVNRIQVERG
jgi:hypothetical protein